MKRWLLHIIYVSVFCMLAASCSSDTDDPTSGTQDGETTEFVFTLALDNALGSRATTDTWGDYSPQDTGTEWENRINSLQVVLYSTSNAYLGKVTALSYTPLAEGINLYRFVGELPVSAISNGVLNCKVMVFANFTQSIGSDTNLANLTFSYNSSYIPMWGVATVNRTVREGKFIELDTPIYLLRAMAKIEVKMSADMLAAEEFTLTDVKLSDYNKEGYSLPNGYTDLDDTRTPNVLAVLKAKKDSEKTAMLFTKVGDSYIAYVPEYAISATDNPVIELILEDVDGNEITDRCLYFREYGATTGKPDGEYFSIVRNHWYEYEINTVSTGVDATLTVKANDWNVKDVSVNYKAEPATEGGTISWDPDVLQTNGEVKLGGGTAMSTDISFKLVGPTGGTWTATLIRTEGLEGAFSFDDTTMVDQVSGNVGEQANLTIYAMNQTVTENCKAKLQIVVKTQDGTRTIDVTEMLDADHLIIQSK